MTSSSGPWPTDTQLLLKRALALKEAEGSSGPGKPGHGKHLAACLAFYP